MRYYPIEKTKCSILVLFLTCYAFPGLASDHSISDVKRLSNDKPARISAKVITYASPDYFYIEDDNRSLGIRVEKTAHGLSVGMRADVVGAIQTNSNMERYIEASSALQTPAPDDFGRIALIPSHLAATTGLLSVRAGSVDRPVALD